LPDAKPVQYRVIERAAAAGTGSDERAEVIAGLRETPARIAPRYFYDELGCALYGAICQLPEYYPTRTEIALFREQRSAIAAAIGPGRQFVDLGAGDCAKAQGWLPFVAAARYVAVDIAGAELHRALARMAPDFPDIEMIGVVTDFSGGVELEDVLDARPALFFYPGSSIGNFTPVEAVAFLRSIHRHCAGRPGSGLLIGVDGKKARERLDAAYDDALGVTASFNRNVLLHLNRRFGFDFPVEAFAHRGFYNAEAGRIEMHLEATRDFGVSLGGERRVFARGERIHTENSYKYDPAEFEALLAEAGFGNVRMWRAASEAYYVFLAN
jgi:dimethylhistidine N-methyltransferase